MGRSFRDDYSKEEIDRIQKEMQEEREFAFEPLKKFLNRMEKLGIEIELSGNIPWYYIDKINGEKVKEKYESDWGFTIGYRPVRINQGRQFHFTDLNEIFSLIRRYTQYPCKEEGSE